MLQAVQAESTGGPVPKMVKLGNRVVFDDDWSYVENKKTGRKMGLRAKDGVYVYDMWVKKPVQKEVSAVSVKNRFEVFQGQVEDLI